MADTAETLRLMRHAADLLDACNPMVNAAEVDRLTSQEGPRQDALRRATSELVALRTAATVLRMVAAAIGDGVDQETREPDQQERTNG